MTEPNRASRAERAAPRMNGSLIVGLLTGFILGAIAGGVMVQQLLQETNEATKPFVGEPAAPEPARPGLPDPDAG